MAFRLVYVDDVDESGSFGYDRERSDEFSGEQVSERAKSIRGDAFADTVYSSTRKKISREEGVSDGKKSGHGERDDDWEWFERNRY
tara:strand:+ start:594 stop:851 length:258 start_codon:yes stop_codon:yes gene_type:complete